VRDYRDLLARRGSVQDVSAVLQLEVRQLDLDSEKLIQGNAGLTGEALAVKLADLQRQRNDLEARIRDATTASEAFATALSVKRQLAENALRAAASKFNDDKLLASQYRQLVAKAKIMQIAELETLCDAFLQASLTTCAEPLRAAVRTVLDAPATPAQ
jgi:hypothetical protein